jgi:FAD/FMN-containing dehydrogenase
MQHESGESTSHSDAGRPLRSRRGVLLAAGIVGAAAATDRLAGAALRSRPLTARTTAQLTPVWLSKPGAGPSPADWNALRRRLSTDKLLRPGESGYGTAKLLYDPRFNNLEPSGIAYCKKATDVAQCVNFARTFSLPVRARSGGHSYEGWSSVNDGLVIDVSEISWFNNGAGNSVSCGSGIDLINFYGGLAAHGKAVPGGSCPTVGIAGLALGGGIGVLARAFGLTCDAIEAMDVVLADGSIINSNSKQHSDLLWASQGGGGGNFGVVTAFTFRTHNLTKLVLFFLTWPWSHASRVVAGWQSWLPHQPDALWSNLILQAPAGSGAPSVGVGGTFIGSTGACSQHLDQLYHLVGSGPTGGTPVEHSYLSAMLQEAGCLTVHGCTSPRVPSYAKSDFFSRPLNSAAISILLRNIEALRGVRGSRDGAGSIAFDGLGGAVNRVHPQATAFVHRDALFDAQYYTSWQWPGTAAGRSNQFRWMTNFYNQLHPHANGQAYQNYVDSALANWQQAYYGVNYHRLQEVKTTYDKNKLFNFPQAIQPLAAEPCHGAC